MRNLKRWQIIVLAMLTYFVLASLTAYLLYVPPGQPGRLVSSFGTMLLNLILAQCIFVASMYLWPKKDE